MFIICRLAQRIVRGDVPEPLLNRKVVIYFSYLFSIMYLCSGENFRDMILR